MRRLLMAMSAAGLLLAAVPARAQFPDKVPDTFRISLGAEYAWFNTNVSYTQFVAGVPVGTSINLEDITRLPNSHVGPALYGYWNFLGRSYIDFGFAYFNRSRTTTISRDIVFGDATYTAGASVDTSFKSTCPYVGYRYGFVKNDSFQLGLGVGVIYAWMESQVSASAGVVGPGGPIVGETTTKTAKISAWVPQAGLDIEGKIAENFTAGLRAVGAGAALSPYKGWDVIGLVHFDYYFGDNFGVGLGYQYSRFSIKKNTSEQSIDFSYRYDGPQAYITLTF
jgi:hypothetical protein